MHTLCAREGSRSGVNRCEGNGTKHQRTFCFPSSLSLLHVPDARPAQHASRHATGIYHSASWAGGVGVGGGMRGSGGRHMPPCTCSAVQAGSPPEVFGWVSVRSGTHLKWRCFSHGEG